MNIKTVFAYLKNLILRIAMYILILIVLFIVVMSIFWWNVFSGEEWNTPQYHCADDGGIWDDEKEICRYDCSSWDKEKGCIPEAEVDTVKKKKEETPVNNTLPDENQK